MTTHSFGRFWPVSWTITHCFGVPDVISTIDESQGALIRRSSTLTVLADSGPFRGLLLTFWGLGVISTIKEPLGALTGWLSTLAVFVDSDPCRGLLLTILGPQSDFHGC